VTTAAATASKRPLAVTIVAALAFAGGVYYLVSGGIALADAYGGDDDRLFEGIVEIVFGTFALLISLGAIGMRRWAWQAYMTWAVVGLTVQILRHFFYDGANYVAMAVNTFAVFALTPRDVQIAFGVRPPDNVDLAAPTRNPLDRD
jgi:hypothetical protein